VRTATTTLPTIPTTPSVFGLLAFLRGLP